MRVEIIDVTPEIAAEYMTHNAANYRILRPTVVRRYADDMKAGLWVQNGTAIRFDRFGNLIDGQHRLQAVINSGTTQRFIVCFDVTGDMLDSGLMRTWHDYTKNAIGRRVQNSLGGAINIIMTTLYSGGAVSNAARLEYYMRHESDLEKAYYFSNRGRNNKNILYRGACIAAIYSAIRLNVIQEKTLEAFCRAVNTGFPEDGYACESALAFRATIQDNKGNGADGTIFCFETTYQAILAFSRGLRSKRRFKPDGNGKEIIKKIHALDAREGIA